ncbi:hypothetical protein AN958_12616 [Leucoagaricus sp. SymC.cos]|nr:hypothetical protein AN958_12616 [Leucoagaricus sp. SymC.cos]
MNRHAATVNKPPEDIHKRRRVVRSSSNIDHPTYIDQRQISHIHPTPSGIGGFERLERAAIRQAIHDSSESSELKQPCCEGTREEHIREITLWGKGEWESTQNARVLWLYGPAGVGKSALAQSCARQIGKSKVATTFFFSRLNQWNHSGSLIPTICYQLAIRSQDYRNLMTDTIAQDPFVLEKSFPDQFQELVVDPIAKLRVHDQGIFSNHLIILDGLDEANKVDTQSIIIRTILHSVDQQSTPFLWAIFSRPEPHIKTAFSSDLADRITLRLLLPVSTDANEDIQAVDQLVDQSAGLFAYTSSAVRYISDDGTNRPGLDDRLKAVLDLGKTPLQDSDNPFAHLDALYVLIMSQIPQSILPNTLALLCIRLNNPWGSDNQLLFYSSILRLRLPDLYAALNNLYSVVEVSKSASGMPLRLSFYHASFGEFLHDIKRSTPKFHIGASDVNQRCFIAAVETLNRLSRYENISKVEAALSWPPSAESRLESHGHDLFLTATRSLFRFSKFMDPQVPVLTHLSSVNWRFAIDLHFLVATASGASTLFQHIPKEWRSKIIQCPHRSPFDVLHQIFLDLRKGKKLKAVGMKRNLMTDTIAHDPFVLEKSFPDQFQELVVDPIAKLRAHDQSIFSNHLIILDGLDEADKVDTQSIIVRAILHSVDQQSTPFLWAIFSRPEPHIETAFSSDLADRFTLRLLLPVSTDANKDIRLYLEDAIRTIRAKHRFPTSMIWPPEEAVDQLVDQSAGLFAYTSNAIRYIGGDGTNRPGLDDRLKAVLDLGKTHLQDSDNPFAHLDALYALIMSQIPRSVLPNTLALLCIRMNIAWGIDNDLLFHSSILRLPLPDLYAALNNLYSVLEVSKSASGMPLQISFYHASFGEFLDDGKRSTPKFHIGTSDVTQRCFVAAVETLNRLSCYENISTVDAALSWPPSAESRLESPGHDLFVMATESLFRFSESMNPEVPVLTHLSSVNWRFAINQLVWVAAASEAKTFFQHIPKEWRSKIIQCPHRCPVDVLHQVFLGLRKGAKLKVVGEKRYVLGSRENKVWLQPNKYGHYEIWKYS